MWYSDIWNVFIDDTEENVLNAEKLGFKGIVFSGYEDAVSRLNDICNSSDLDYLKRRI